MKFLTTVLMIAGLCLGLAACERYNTTYAEIEPDVASGLPAPSGTVDPQKGY